MAQANAGGAMSSGGLSVLICWLQLVRRSGDGDSAYNAADMVAARSPLSPSSLAGHVVRSCTRAVEAPAAWRTTTCRVRRNSTRAPVPRIGGVGIFVGAAAASPCWRVAGPAVGRACGGGAAAVRAAGLRRRAWPRT
ncbi:MAG: hypothetical protein MZW92_58835 [Comamonadaceae bacterium]|nr:hypothetical protein [Comamonadaceae bacterium]